MKNGVRIAEVAEVNPRAKGLSTINGDALVAFVPMAGLSEEGVLSEVQERPLKLVMRGYTPFQEGDVLVAKISPSLENGKAAFVERLSHRVGFGSTELHVLRPTGRVLGRYLFYAIWNSDFRQAAARHFTGTAGQKRVPASFLEDFKIRLPAINEQRRIVEILDRADATRRAREDGHAMAATVVESIFNNLIGDPIANPKKWPSKFLGELLPQRNLIVDGPFGSSLRPECYVARGIRVIRNLNIKDDSFDDSSFVYVTKEKFEQINRSAVESGDVLISTKGTIGNTCLMPEFPGQSVLSASGTVRIRLPSSSGLLSEVLVAQLISKSFKKYSVKFQSGTIQRYLNLSSIRKFRILVPPEKIQREFAAKRFRARGLVGHHKAASKEAELLCAALARNLLREGL